MRGERVSGANQDGQCVGFYILNDSDVENDLLAPLNQQHPHWGRLGGVCTSLDFLGILIRAIALAEQK